MALETTIERLCSFPDVDLSYLADPKTGFVDIELRGAARGILDERKTGALMMPEAYPGLGLKVITDSAPKGIRLTSGSSRTLRRLQRMMDESAARVIEVALTRHEEACDEALAKARSILAETKK